MTKGMIFDIEEFAVHDGPGIRKTVFFKGCPLRCNWCHNPEGMSFKRELMISKGVRRICGAEYEARDLAKELLKGKEILEMNGGGITISGGEPLAQPEFLLELIKELKPLHVAVETSGYASESVFKEVIESIDLIIMDIKHVNPEVHKLVTGVDNSIILKNLQYLCASNKRFYIRIPLIPGINDTIDNMEQTAKLLEGAKGLVRVEFLPYHKTAGAKYAMIGKEYKPLFDTEMPARVFQNPFTKLNIRSEVL